MKTQNPFDGLCERNRDRDEMIRMREALIQRTVNGIEAAVRQVETTKTEASRVKH